MHTHVHTYIIYRRQKCQHIYIHFDQMLLQMVISKQTNDWLRLQMNECSSRQRRNWLLEHAVRQYNRDWSHDTRTNSRSMSVVIYWICKVHWSIPRFWLGEIFPKINCWTEVCVLVTEDIGVCITHKETDASFLSHKTSIFAESWIHPNQEMSTTHDLKSAMGKCIPTKLQQVCVTWPTHSYMRVTIIINKAWIMWIA